MQPKTEEETDRCNTIALAYACLADLEPYLVEIEILARQEPPHMHAIVFVRGNATIQRDGETTEECLAALESSIADCLEARIKGMQYFVSVLRNDVTIKTERLYVQAICKMGQAEGPVKIICFPGTPCEARVFDVHKECLATGTGNTDVEALKDLQKHLAQKFTIESENFCFVRNILSLLFAKTKQDESK